ncbi:MAG: hypothetical protein LBD58_03405 [Treponema sp.]|jgi:hypothetical protein|nr:hypothetical protein [Treponema sp.]
MHKRITFGFCAAIVAMVAFVGCGGGAAKIDYRMNIAGLDANSYFNWSAKGVSVQDGFDAATGASKAKSTTRFDQAVTYDIPENAAKHTGYAIPSGLRGLFLYPVSADSTRVYDNLTVTANGKQVVIRYVHRDSAYEIATDANGKLDITTGCKAARGIATTEDQHTFTLKPEFSKTGEASGNMTDFDWSKATLAPDVFSANATRHYTGALDVAYENNYLTVKGSLKEVK